MSYRPRVVRATQTVGLHPLPSSIRKFDKDDILSKSLIPGSNEDDRRVKPGCLSRSQQNRQICMSRAMSGSHEGAPGGTLIPDSA